MNLSKAATALALSVAFAATLAAAPQATKPAPAKSNADQSKAATKPAPSKTMTEEVKPADLPKAVTDAAMKDHPKATITSAKKMTKGMDVTYKVMLKEGSKSLGAMTYTADGKMVMPKAKKGK